MLERCTTLTVFFGLLGSLLFLGGKKGLFFGLLVGFLLFTHLVCSWVISGLVRPTLALHSAQRGLLVLAVYYPPQGLLAANYTLGMFLADTAKVKLAQLLALVYGLPEINCALQHRKLQTTQRSLPVTHGATHGVACQ